MKILVTGSKGLIGSSLCLALRQMGVSVLGMDLKWGIDHPEYGNILDSQAIKKAVANCDGIVHLAAVSRVLFGQQNPALCWETNVQGTTNIIHAALKSEKKPWIIYASSREVYGQQGHLPVHETAPLQPVNIYGESKVEAEKIVLAAQKKGVRAAILRFSNVYGSVVDHCDRVIPAFCLAAIKQQELRVEGKHNLFDFTYIEDVIKGILSSIYLLAQGMHDLLPIHLTTGIPSSLGEVAEIARLAGGHSAKITDAPSRSYDVAKFFGDPTRAKNKLRWSACINVEEGIARLINQYRIFLIAQKEVKHLPREFATI